MRYVKYALLALLAIVLVTLAIANREFVELRLLPSALTSLMGFQETVSLPIFVVILASVGLGLLIGYVLEWLREHRHRRAADRRQREINLLQRENRRLRHERHEGEDEVMALLDEPPARAGTGTALART